MSCANKVKVEHEVVIRRATLDDLPVVLTFDDTDEHMGAKRINPEKRLAGKIGSGDIFLAFIGEEPAGYARVDILWPEMCPLFSWAFVRPEYRKMGIYKRLSQTLFSELKREGFTFLLRCANTDRPHMIQKLRNEDAIECGHIACPDGSKEIFFWHKL